MGRYLCLLLFLSIAPACAPDGNALKDRGDASKAKPLVLLTDAATWQKEELEAYKDSLEKEHYRVLVSGFSGETPTELAARVPWLLQPGVSLFLYDEDLAGPAGGDSIRQILSRLGHDIPVEVIR